MLAVLRRQTIRRFFFSDQLEKFRPPFSVIVAAQGVITILAEEVVILVAAFQNILPTHTAVIEPAVEVINTDTADEVVVPSPAPEIVSTSTAVEIIVAVCSDMTLTPVIRCRCRSRREWVGRRW